MKSKNYVVSEGWLDTLITEDGVGLPKNELIEKIEPMFHFLLKHWVEGLVPQSRSPKRYIDLIASRARGFVTDESTSEEALEALKGVIRDEAVKLTLLELIEKENTLPGLSEVKKLKFDLFKLFTEHEDEIGRKFADSPSLDRVIIYKDGIAYTVFYNSFKDWQKEQP